jgi:hypothetical protein
MEDKKINIVYCKGSSGGSLYINDFRVSGSKPWGGGTTIKEWDISLKDLKNSLGEDIISALPTDATEKQIPVSEAVEVLEGLRDHHLRCRKTNNGVELIDIKTSAVSMYEEITRAIERIKGGKRIW